MKPYRVKKKAGGEHFKIFIRNKFPIPKAPLKLFTKVHGPAGRMAGPIAINVKE